MDPSTSSVPQKRKEHNRFAPSKIPVNQRSSKRLKIHEARSILVQTSDKALDKNGDLDASAFVKAREHEIKAMVASMGASKTVLSTRAFQQVPKALRRRTASHNVKRVPKRLRARAAKEMKDDNTPTVTSRRRKPTPHQRIRLEKAKELKKLGALTKKKRDESRKQKPGETDPEKMVSITPRVPKLKRDTLSRPAKPPARFRKRQIHKSWLPTHIFHAKRARMTPPKEPLWRFAVPLTPTEKCYRPTHRAATSRGCVAWDMSYTATIGVEGAMGSLLGLLRSIGVHENTLLGKQGEKYIKGTRWWEGWIRHRDGDQRWIAKVGVVWSPESPESCATEALGYNISEQATNRIGEVGQELDESLRQKKGDAQKRVAKREPKKLNRKLFIRVHPSAFFQVWNEVLKVAKIQRPAAMIEDLRFDIGSIEVIGPESTEALVGALHPITSSVSAPGINADESADNEWVDIDTPEKVWPQLAAVTNPASLPVNAILGCSVSDPRLHHPPRTVKQDDRDTTNGVLLELMSSWPPDLTQNTCEIFDRAKRLTASRQLASQKAINRRKGEALPGSYPVPAAKDPKIPVLLMASRTSTTTGQGSWTLLLPWDCVLPVWYSLMHYPLASGGNPRFGGLQERRQISFEQAVPWFPADYPGTKAGFEWELMEREKRKQEWDRRPKGERVAWESVDLGKGKKGEIGLGWACDWERLFQGPLPSSNSNEAKIIPKHSKKLVKGSTLSESQLAEPSTLTLSQVQPPKEPPEPPLAMHHLTTPHSTITPIAQTALSLVHLTLVTSGHPARNARIYRLPTTDDDLREKWLALAHPSRRSKERHPSQITPVLPENAAPHQRAQRLAASLLCSSICPSDAGINKPKAGDRSYPCVPDETDLIGFVTTGNYHLGEGKNEAIGNVAVARVMGGDVKKGKGGETNMCIVREAGQSIGRLARWKFV